MNDATTFVLAQTLCITSAVLGYQSVLLGVELRQFFGDQFLFDGLAGKSCSDSLIAFGRTSDVDAEESGLSRSQLRQIVEEDQATLGEVLRHRFDVDEFDSIGKFKGESDIHGGLREIGRAHV